MSQPIQREFVSAQANGIVERLRFSTKQPLPFLCVALTALLWHSSCRATSSAGETTPPEETMVPASTSDNQRKAPGGPVPEHPLQPVAFQDHIIPVLTKLGCNSGTCHGSLHGKGGFRLSLRGQDNDLDYRSIVYDMAGRRVDLLEPESSLLLTKPLGIVPHAGGIRLTKDSAAYHAMRDWIQSGLPEINPSSTRTLVRLALVRTDDLADSEKSKSEIVIHSNRDSVSEEWIRWPIQSAKLASYALWSDGTTTDVTTWTKFEGSAIQGATVDSGGTIQVERPIDITVTGYYQGKLAPIRLNFVQSDPSSEAQKLEDITLATPTNSHTTWIDQAIDRRLDKLNIRPMPHAEPATWIKRLYLTVAGRLPTRDELKHYLEDTSIDRNEQAIDRVLADPQTSAMLALKWSDLLRNEPKVMSEKGVVLWFDWLRNQFIADTSLPTMMSSLLTTVGSTYESPAASFHRTHRDPTVAAEAVGQVFLGIRMQCAKCHNHPFDVWTQDDYYGLSAFFTTIERKQIDNQPRDSLDTHVITGDEIISLSDKPTEIYHPGKARKIPARPLEFASSNKVSSEKKEIGATPLAQLASALTEQNAQFEKNMVNRIWAHGMGRGIVDPVDDFRSSNPPSNPELLDALREEFASHDYSVRWLLREILRSEAFLRASVPDTDSDPENIRVSQFAGFASKRLIAEVLQDAIADATETVDAFAKQTETKGEKAKEKDFTRAVLYASVPRRNPLLRAFGKPERLTDCDCERSSDVSLRQSLLLLNDEHISSKLKTSGGIVERLITQVHSAETWSDAIVELYQTILSRSPTDRELSILQGMYNSDRSMLRSRLEDIAWALINSKEFLFLQ